LGVTAAPSVSATPEEVAATAGVPVPVDSDGDGDLDAPTTAEAVEGTKARKGPIEDLSQRTETTRTFANFDGTFTDEQYSGIVRLKEKGGGWEGVDYTLERQSDGSWAPKASPIDVRIDGGASNEAARVTFDDGESLAVTWPESLPKPKVRGGVATYELSASTDLLISVTASGVNARIRLNQAPKDDDPMFEFGLRADSLDLKKSKGGLQLLDEAGDPIGKTSTLVAWDAKEDEAGSPTEVVPLQVALSSEGGSGDVTRHSLELKTPDGYLNDPETEYPVIIDPDIGTLERLRDTWVRGADTVNHGFENQLVVGKINGSSNTNAANAYLKFHSGPVTGKSVVSAELNLWQFYAYTCSAKQMDIAAVTDYWNENMTPGGQPAVTGAGVTSIVANRGTTGCDNGWTKADVTAIAQGWANSSITNEGIRLKIPADKAGQSSYERRFCSMNPQSGAYCGYAERMPYLSVSYLPDPPAPEPIGYTGIVTKNGVPVANATVMLEVWPNDEYLGGLPEDADVSLWQLGSVQTDVNGRYDVTALRGVIPPQYKEADGSINVSTEVTDGQIVVPAGATLTIPEGSTTATAASQAVVDLGTAAAFDSANLPSTDGSLDNEANIEADEPEPSTESNSLFLQITSGFEQWNNVPSPNVQEPTVAQVAAAPADYNVESAALPVTPVEETRFAASASATTVSAQNIAVRDELNAPLSTTSVPSLQDGECKWQPKSWVRDRKERFQSIYNWSGAKATLTQTTATKHELGVAVQFPYQGVTWKASAMKSTGTSGQGTTADQVNKTFYNNVDYRYFNFYCSAGTFQGHPDIRFMRQELRPMKVSGFFTKATVSDKKSWKKRCVFYPKSRNYSFSLTKSKSYTKSGGVDLGFLNVNAQSGFTNESKQTFKISSASFICTNDQNTDHLRARGLKIWSKTAGQAAGLTG
jgi:hypothetical protein